MVTVAPLHDPCRYRSRCRLRPRVTGATGSRSIRHRHRCGGCCRPARTDRSEIRSHHESRHRRNRLRSHWRRPAENRRRFPVFPNSSEPAASHKAAARISACRRCPAARSRTARQANCRPDCMMNATIGHDARSATRSGRPLRARHSLRPAIRRSAQPCEYPASADKPWPWTLIAVASVMINPADARCA